MRARRLGLLLGFSVDIATRSVLTIQLPLSALPLLFRTFTSSVPMSLSLSVRRSTFVPYKPPLTEKNLPDQSGKVGGHPNSEDPPFL